MDEVRGNHDVIFYNGDPKNAPKHLVRNYRIYTYIEELSLYVQIGWSTYESLNEFELLTKETLCAKNSDGCLVKATDEQIKSAEGDDSEMCAVCYEPIKSVDVPDRHQHTLPCNHFFHAICVAAWAKRKFSCPMCRAAFPFYYEFDTDMQGYNQIHRPIGMSDELMEMLRSLD